MEIPVKLVVSGAVLDGQEWAFHDVVVADGDRLSIEVHNGQRIYAEVSINVIAPQRPPVSVVGIPMDRGTD